MSDESKNPVQSALFHRVQNSIFVDGKYTYRVFSVYERDIEPGAIFDEKRLKRRLLSKIMKMNNDRIRHYSKIENKELIYETTPFKLVEFSFAREEENSTGGKYSIYPLEFICNKCGKIYVAKTSDDLNNIPTRCTWKECHGKIEQNTIIMYCEECGSLSTMNCYCIVANHGANYSHINRRSKEDIQTWETYCVKCKEDGGKSVDFMRFPCHCGGKRRPLPVRDGGVVSPVVMTFVDLEGKPKSDNSEAIRIAVYYGLLSNDQLRNVTPSLKLESEDLLENIQLVIDAAENPAVAEYAKNGMTYITRVIDQVKMSFEDVDLDELNDIQAALRQSSSYDDYLVSLPADKLAMYGDNYKKIKDEFKIFDIRYVKDLRVVMTAIGTIVGINKFYEEGFIPHFIPFRKRRTDEEIYAIASPIVTEGILFRLNPIEVCKWLRKNKHLDRIIDNESDARVTLQHLAVDSEGYSAVKTLVHTLSHILIKQSSVYTGLDEGTCAELLFVSDASALIYSTSNVNIGGFEYAFKYSIPNWFSCVMDSAEDCTLDPTCIKEEGKCFCCMYVPEFVCSNFNKQLSRQSLIGGYFYEHGFWK
jgi:hypothetical protein